MQRGKWAVSALLSVLGMVGLHLHLDSYEASLAGGEAIGVLVARRDLAIGDTLGPEDLLVHQVPGAYVGARQIRAGDLEALDGGRLLQAVPAGGLLTWGDLGVDRLATTLASSVTRGRRAYVLGRSRRGFGNLLRPGDRVDLLFTGPGDSSVTRPFMQNLLVLAVGSQLADSRAPGSAQHGSASGRVAVSVTPEQSLMLTQAESRGRVGLVLRNPEDQVVRAPVGPVDAKRLRESLGEVAHLPTLGGGHE